MQASMNAGLSNAPAMKMKQMNHAPALQAAPQLQNAAPAMKQLDHNSPALKLNVLA